LQTTPNPPAVPASIDDLLTKDADESADAFEARRRLTVRLATLPDYKLGPVTAITVGRMLVNRANLGTTYTPDAETALNYLVALLER
jgi:hypothetical protein